MTLRTLQSPRGFVIVPIHYSMDPEKSTPEWLLSERRKYPTQQDWDKEMEMDFRSVAGDPCYPNWSDGIHLTEDVRLLPGLPLCVACDFNVNPCIWEIAQIVRGSYLHVVDEIALGPVDVDEMVKELRNRYPTWTAEVWFYGDATGKALNVQTKMGCWDLIRLHMAGYPVPVSYRVPPSNPGVSERLKAVAARLRDEHGRSWIKVHPRCVELIKDAHEVVYDSHGTKELQVYDRENPYHRRTHALSAVGYLIAREWPLPVLLGRQERVPRQKRTYGKLLGSV